MVGLTPKQNHPMKRRNFLKTAAATSAGVFVLPRFSIGKPGLSANSKLNIAMIGSGNIAKSAYNGCRGENIVGLCDIDSRMFPDWAATERTPTFQISV